MGAFLKMKKFGVPESEGHDTLDLSALPSPVVMAHGLAGVGHGQYQIVTDNSPDAGHNVNMGATDTKKQPYRVPSMAEVRAVPWNGYKVASTFSGCGGSCLGYRMAGFKVVWANEFVPAAQDSYRANKEPDCVLDCRDIHDVRPEDILAAAGLKAGELDLLDGSPPCQAFSTAGKREKGWGKAKRYEHGAEQCNETLFFEYVRLLKGLQPKVFVAENVKGLTAGKAKGMMGDHQLDMLDDQSGTILHSLMDAGYVVGWRVLNAADLGVPQTRNRVIFVGVRRDLADRFRVGPCWPEPSGWFYTVKDAIPWIDSVTVDPKGQFRVQNIDAAAEPMCTVRVTPSASSQTKVAVRMEGGNGFNQHAPVDVSDAPAPTIMAGGPHGGSGMVRVVYQQGGGFDKKEIDLDRPVPTVCASQASQFVVGKGLRLPSSRLKEGAYGVQDVNSDRPCPTVACASPGNGLAAPVVRRDPETGASLELDASRVKVCDGTQEFGSAGDCAVADRPAPTVLTPSNSCVVKSEKRKFTIAELRRICAFPDDFVLTGSYAQQWERLGNSVPPVMMRHIAQTILERVLRVAHPSPDMSYRVPPQPEFGAAAPPTKAKKASIKVSGGAAAPVAVSAPARLSGVMDDKWKRNWWE